jgi:hypothetical protein
MCKPYYEKPLNPQPGEWREQEVKGDRVTDLGYTCPGIDPTVPGTQPRGEPHLARPYRDQPRNVPSEETRNQQATSGKSRTESGTP